MNPQDTSRTGEPGLAGTVRERGAEAYEKAQQTASQAYQKTAEAAGEAYEKTSRAVGGAYDQAVGYGRENPALMTLVALGIGVGLGFLLASSLRRSNPGSITEPIVDAVHDFASGFMR
jgi:ElaB/YqjD/DUF883 family membrane-anchored ribosome-binding protein